jgi:WD40 repeat protein
VTCVAVSPDGKTVASGGGSLLRLWNAADMRLQATVGHYAVTTVAFSKDGKVLVSGGGDGYVRVWDLSADAPPKARSALQAGASTGVTAVAFAPDDKTVAAAVSNGELHLFDVSGPGKETALVSAHEGGATAVAFLPEGKELLSGGADKKVKVWDVGDKLEEKAALTPPGDKPAAVTALAVTADGATLAEGCADGAVLLWNLPASSKVKPRTALPAVGGYPYSVAFSKSQTLAVAYADGTVREWGTGGQPTKERHKLEGHAGAATAVAFSPDEKLLFSGGVDWMVRSWELGAKPKERFQPESHLSAAFGVAVSPDGRSLATASQDGVLRVWDQTKAPVATKKYIIPPQKGDMTPLTCVAFAPDGKAVVVGGSSTTARVYDPAVGKPLAVLAGHPGPVTGLAFGPDGRVLSASLKTLFLWDAAKGTQLKSFPDHDTNITCLALSPDGRRAASGSGYYELKDGKIVYRNNQPLFTDCVLRLWDVDAGKELDCNKSAATPLTATAFSADGRRVFSAWSSEPALHAWDATKTPLAEAAALKGASGYATAAVASPDGRSVAVRGLDGSVTVWDLETGQKTHTFILNENVGGLAYAPDSRHLAVGLYTGVTYVLRLGPPEKAGK